MKVLRVFARLKAAVAIALISLPVAASELKIFAAASLTEALDEALVLCAAETKLPVKPVYAGSGTLARQIDRGAPADIFISAHPRWMDWLEGRGIVSEKTRINLLKNHLVIVRATGGDRPIPLPDKNRPYPKDIRFGIGGVNSVPAGIYAKQALESSGWWAAVKNNLVQSSNVREILTWVLRGETAFGIVYKTDALNNQGVEIVHEFPAENHSRIHYPIAVIAGENAPKAQRLLDCLAEKKAGEVFSAYGFVTLGVE